VTISHKDKDVLRELAQELAEIASLPIHKERAEAWRRLNDLEAVKPMIWINEIPWHEMNVNDELTLETGTEDTRAREYGMDRAANVAKPTVETFDALCCSIEFALRKRIYKWKHMPGDMVVEPVLYCPLIVYDTGFGITEDVDIARTDEASSIVSRHFHLQIQEEDDLQKIERPRIEYDAQATERNYQFLEDLLGDILPVEKRGAPGFWFAPWDELIRWWGVEEAMMDMVARPQLVHAAMERLTQAYLSRLDQYEEQGLLSRNDRNVRIGSGGYGYTDELPSPNYDPGHIRTQDLWGSAAAQIFSDVSPEMHREFALQYEKRWLERFGLNYYGCCEPLHLKVDMLASVPNLRKISMSPWIDLDVAVEKVGDDYIFSHKPNPAVFAKDTWNPEQAREELVQVLEKAQDCVVEVIMKDISTVRYQPQRLWEWAEMAREVTETFAP
jgi:hypothetical protein